MMMMMMMMMKVKTKHSTCKCCFDAILTIRTGTALRRDCEAIALPLLLLGFIF